MKIFTNLNYINMPFELPQLDYNHDALEPHIDQKTMEIHHGKHHAGYTAKLNAALEGTDHSDASIDELMTTLNMSNGAIRNNGGGLPSGSLADAINRDFGSFDNFKDAFSKAAATQFGSGWAWLCVLEGGKLEICSTPNQDNPLMPGVACEGTPILGIDVWEHAYYLNYQNRRPDYIEAFFNVVSWEEVQKNYDK